MSRDSTGEKASGRQAAGESAVKEALHLQPPSEPWRKVLWADEVTATETFLLHLLSP